MSPPGSPAPSSLPSSIARDDRSRRAATPQLARPSAPRKQTTTAPALMPAPTTTTPASNVGDVRATGLPDDWRASKAADGPGRTLAAALPKSNFDAFKRREKGNSGPQAQHQTHQQHAASGLVRRQQNANRPAHLVDLKARLESAKQLEGRRAALQSTRQSFATSMPLGAEDDLFDRGTGAKPLVALPTRSALALEHQASGQQPRKKKARDALKKKVASLIQSGCDSDSFVEELVAAFPNVV
ncbi:hypothetical protein AURDEDRAFT_175875 [Auricularia subglabra TFB-10046 SS5]|nr:hypothetical protein AURDEDRAFT_175875 [Auricularia subglabra TFB-10046 SS5]